MSSRSHFEGSEIPPTLGLVAGKYEIIRLIGRGGMGSVWEARHVSLGTKVAIKFVEVDEAHGEEARARFQNEARAAATIRSKHAIKVYDHGLVDGVRPYIVMELLTGEPLDRRLSVYERLPLEDVARIIQQVARALQQAHDAGITHRDLKPENIFLEQSPDDDEEVAKVLDFGIAKMRDPIHALPVSSSTKTGVLMGTPFFMSPEQARGLKTVDYRSDLWSLGVIVFRCVTGILPFDGESLGDLLVKICASPVPVPSAVSPAVPPSLDTWMLRCLARDPGARFQSALELADALADVAGISIRAGGRRGSQATPVPTLLRARGAAGPSGSSNANERAFSGDEGQAWRLATPAPSPDEAPTLNRSPTPHRLTPPIAAVTSSPFTATPSPIPMNGGVGAAALSLAAGAVLMAAAAGTFWFVQRTTANVANVTGASAAILPTSASGAPPSESVPSSASSASEEHGLAEGETLGAASAPSREKSPAQATSAHPPTGGKPNGLGLPSRQADAVNSLSRSTASSTAGARRVGIAPTTADTPRASTRSPPSPSLPSPTPASPAPTAIASGAPSFPGSDPGY